MKFSALISAAAIFSLAAATPVAAPGAAADVKDSRDIIEFTGGNSTVVRRTNYSGTVQFFSGNACDRPNGVGGLVNIDSRTPQCIDATNRHSIEVKGCRAYIYFYDRGGCPGSSYSEGVFQADTCTNINTGRPWGSSRVSCY